MFMKASSVSVWKDALLKLSDKHFFNLVRLYLGPVKTPFSKQKLADSLAAFLRKPEVRKNILAALDGLDLKLITGVFVLTEPDRMKLVRLFSGEYSFPELYDRILNLEERLLIFRTGESSSSGYRVNPYLEEDLRGLADFSCLFSSGGRELSPAEEGFFSGAVPASDLTAAGVFCYFLHCRPAEKMDSTLKKKDAELFAAVFPDFPCHVDVFSAALKRLSLVKNQDGRLVPDVFVWKEFASLPVLERTVWLCAAASCRLSVPSVINERASLFSLLAGCLSSGGKYSRSDLERFLFLIEDKIESGAASGNTLPVKAGSSGRSRVASMIDAGTSSCAEVPPLQAALSFGLLVQEGSLFSLNSALSAGLPAEGEAAPGVLFVEPSFDVTLLQGATLKDLLPLMYFMEPVQLQTAGIFRITRKACSSAFSSGKTEKNAEEAFSSFGAALPENVRFSLGDWYSSFSSVHLYNGFVLKVEKRVRPFFEKGGNLHSIVREELAPGVYLLTQLSKTEVEKALTAEGLDFLSPQGTQVRASAPAGDALSVPSRIARKTVFHAGLPSAADTGFDMFLSCRENRPPEDDKERVLLYAELKEHLLSRLESMDIPESVRNVLEARIAAKTVVSDAQLDPAGVRFEKNEAKALDFPGKLRLIEQACKTGSLLEITTDEGSESGVKACLFRPANTVDLSQESPGKGRRLRVFGTLEPEHKPCSFSVARASSIRILSGSIFSDDASFSD